MLKPKIRGYEIHQIIGRGAGSKIYRATKKKTGQQMAVKHVTKSVILDRMVDFGEYVPHRDKPPRVDYKSFYNQLKLEFEVCSRLSKTPVAKFVPGVYDFRPVVNWCLLVIGHDLIMDYVPGENLRANRDYSIVDLINYYHQAAKILYAIHGIGYLHADLKPQHMIITPEKQLKLLDFGQCRKPRQTHARQQGTPDYMAPEQFNGHLVDVQTDIYCLGASFYWILSGKSNRPAMSMAGAGVGDLTVGFADRARSLREDNPSVPEPLDRLVVESCNPRMEERPASMREVIERLELLLR